MEDEPKKEKKVKLVSVSVVKKAGNTFLVEYSQGSTLSRVYVPMDEVTDGKVAMDILQLATPYGLPWATLFQFDPAKVEFELKRAGIWTADDLRNNPKVAAGVLSAALNINYGALLQAAKKYLMEV